MASMNHSLIVKCTRQCNFACSYCTDRRSSGSPLSFDNTVGLVKSVLAQPEAGRTTFIFHGGEPLLLGIDYFKKLLCLQQLCNENRRQISNILQTNGSLISEEWIRFFQENEIQLGISLDGPPESHNLFRRYVGGEPTCEDVIQNIRALNEAGVRFGVLCVASDTLLQCGARKVFDFFRNLPVSKVGFLPLRAPQTHFENQKHATDFYDYRMRYASFMCELYRLWIEADNPAFRIRELDSMLSNLLGGVPTICVDNGPCVGKQFGVDPSGVLAHCDKFFHDADFCFGSLEHTALSEVLASDRFARAQEIEREARAACDSCEWHSICQGGCLKDAVLFEKSGLQDRIPHCHLKVIYDFIFADVQQMAAPSEPAVDRATTNQEKAQVPA